MTEDEIRQILEEIDPDSHLSPEIVEEFLASVREREEKEYIDGDRRGDAIFHTLADQYQKETDWRKKAALAARIISAGL
jgi:hypothetical protein